MCYDILEQHYSVGFPGTCGVDPMQIGDLVQANRWARKELGHIPTGYGIIVNLDASGEIADVSWGTQPGGDPVRLAPYNVRWLEVISESR